MVVLLASGGFELGGLNWLRLFEVTEIRFLLNFMTIDDRQILRSCIFCTILGHKYKIGHNCDQLKTITCQTNRNVYDRLDYMDDILAAWLTFFNIKQ